jgi:serine/threonine protein kinase
MPEQLLGRTIGQYRILEQIGAGGMGQVYAALDTQLDRRVALKVLPPEFAEDASRRERFEREAKALAAINYPNIVGVHSIERADGLHFMTMELVKGRTFANLIPVRGLQVERFFSIAIPLVAVAAAHQEGIVHRDLKPANVMVDKSGRVKVLDFGIAKAGGDAGSPTVTIVGHVVGTPQYMSPEQAEARLVDARSDPDGSWLAVQDSPDVYRVPLGGGERELLASGYTPRFSADGRFLYTTLTPRGGIWRWSLADGRETQMTRLDTRRGRMWYMLAVGERDLYFNYAEDDGDIWVMDVKSGQ